MDTLTKTKVSTRTMAMAAVGAVGLVAAAVIGLSGGSTGTSTCIVTVMRAPDSPQGASAPGRTNQVVEKVLVGVPSTCQNQTLQSVSFFATSTINNMASTSTMKAYKGSVAAANMLGSKNAPAGTGWGAALFSTPPATLTSFAKGTTTTIFFTADTNWWRAGNRMQSQMNALKFTNTGTSVRTLPLFGFQLTY